MDVVKKVETTICHHVLTSEGIIVTRVKENMFENLELAKENGRAVLSLKGDGPVVPILVDFSKAAGQDIEARKYYSEHSGEWSNKAALLVNSPVARVMGNIYLGINKPVIPTKLFTDEQLAIAWLKE